jgi:gas vesicle protein
VEQARSKLAHDLAVLRSPSTVSSFTESLKHEALDAKDAVVEQAKDAIQTKVSDFIEDLKAKAAANPAAALTIGAGIAWQFIRNPPIATALIGAGLFSLFRTNGLRARDDAEYLRRGKARLKEQVGELGTGAMNVAADVQDAVTAKAGEMVDTAKNKAQAWAQSAAQTAVETAGATREAVRDQTDSFASAVRRARNDLADRTADAVSAVQRTGDDLADQAAGAARRFSSTADDTVRDPLAAGQRVISDTEARDKVLLGVAGLAVAAALGIAYQKRALEDVE